MANEFRLYIVCPACSGSAVALLNREQEENEEAQPCPRCEIVNEDDPLGPVDFDGLRHIYYGHISKTDE